MGRNRWNTTSVMTVLMSAGIVLYFASTIVAANWVGRRIDVSRNCTGLLSQTANASNVQLAVERLGIAIEYIESQEWTDGYSHIVIKTEADNVGYWYRNLKMAHDGLAAASNRELSDLEESNILIKTREVLVDEANGQTYVVVPGNLYYYPHAHRGMFLLNRAAIIVGIISISLAFWAYSMLTGASRITPLEVIVGLSIMIIATTVIFVGAAL